MAKDNNNNQPPRSPSRRNLLKGAGLVGSALAGSTVMPAVLGAENSAAQAAAIPLREALETLTMAEADTLEAMVDRILPADESGPGARQAGALYYIDRSLAADNLADRELYLIGLAMLDEHARRRHGDGFHRLTAEVQDQLLTALQAEELSGFRPSGAAFFGMVRNHTIDGTFCDPLYGGNRDFIGWDMLGYPGVRSMVSESDVAQGRDLAPNHVSAYELPGFVRGRRNGGRGGSSGN